MPVKYLISLVLLVLSLTAWAGDSGHYFDPDRTGEGLMLFRSGDLVQINIFTYQPNQGCDNTTIPVFTILTEENCHESRWFISAGDNIIGDTVIGKLYIGLGFDYPNGFPVFGDPFAFEVGDAFRVGTYTLQRFEGGWRMSVDRFGTVLSESDPLFNTIFHFTAPLVVGKD